MINIEVLDKNIPYEELYHVMQEAFKERVEQGLIFKCTTFSLEEFIENMQGMSAIVARQDDGDTSRIVGFQKFVIENGCVDTGIIAVLPDCKRLGIGNKIFEKSKELGLAKNCSYMLADTALDATSSVKWHLKNGYFRHKLHSYVETNYYSLIFRQQLKHHWLWSNPFLRGLYYEASSLTCRMFHNSDGTFTPLRRLLNPIISKLI